MSHTLAQSFGQAFLGRSPGWYKLTIVGFLLLNPIVMLLAGPTVTGWLLLGEFIFTLAMALLRLERQRGGGTGEKPRDADRFAGLLAVAVVAGLDARQRLLDFL